MADRPVLPVREVFFRLDETRGQFVPARDGDPRATLVTAVDACGRSVRGVYDGSPFGGERLVGWKFGRGHGSLMCPAEEIRSWLDDEARRRRMKATP
jgi:hypothetical protein